MIKKIFNKLLKENQTFNEEEQAYLKEFIEKSQRFMLPNSAEITIKIQKDNFDENNNYNFFSFSIERDNNTFKKIQQAVEKAER